LFDHARQLGGVSLLGLAGRLQIAEASIDAPLGLFARGDVKQGAAEAGGLARRVSYQAVVDLDQQLAAVAPDVMALYNPKGLPS
jgi:hypothetical protein